MQNNLSYKGHIVWHQNGLFCALSGLKADTWQGLRRLIDQKYGYNTP